MKVDSVIKLTKPLQKLFFKGTNVTSYPSFDRHLEAAATPLRRVDNPRVSLSQERDYVKRNKTIMKARTLDTLDEQLELTSDEDQGNALPTLSQKRRVQSSQPLPPPRKPCREGSTAACSALANDGKHMYDDFPLTFFNVFLLDDVISLHDDDSDGPPMQQTTVARLMPGVSTPLAKFPSSFYTVDVHAAFTFKSTGKLTVEAQFEQFFSLPFRSSTYYDHKTRWLSVPRDARDKAVAAGYTEEGQYSTFLATHAAKDTPLKAAKRKLRAAKVT